MKLKILSILCLSFILSACNSNTEVLEVSTLEAISAESVEEKEEVIVDSELLIEDNIIESESVVVENLFESDYLEDIPLVDMIIGDSIKYSEEEIKEALFIVYDSFIIPDATLIKIWYDEDKSDELKAHFMETGRGSHIDGLTIDNVLVVLSDFKLAEDSTNPVLEAGETYTDYQWYLVRMSSSDSWILDSAGY